MKKYFAEGVLIIFSVLFALFINKMFESYKTHKEKKIALESIYKEIDRNSKMISVWNEHHSEIQNRIVSVMNGTNDSLRMELLKYPSFNLTVIFGNGGFINGVLSNTAWETAKSTGIIAEFDFETTQKLTEVYSIQNIVMDKTVDKIIEYIFNPESQNIENIDGVLNQYHLRFRELNGQEKTLRALYKDALSKLRNSI